MQFEISPKDTINSINQALQDFIQTSWSINDTLDVYCSFDYNEVKNAFQNKFPDGDVTPKPIIHLWENSIGQGNNTYLNTQNEGERLFFNYDVFIVIDDNIKPGIPRKILLNELMGELKYKIDNYGSKELGFKNIKMTTSEGILGKNSDNLYAGQQRLTFEIYKELR